MRTKWSRALQRFIEFFKDERTEYTEYGIRIVHTPDGFYVPMEDRKKLMDLMSKDLNAVAPLPGVKARRKYDD